jgi:hypothetical protein
MKCFGTVFADVDRDGDEDFVVSNGHIIDFNYPKTTRFGSCR